MIVVIIVTIGFIAYSKTKNNTKSNGQVKEFYKLNEQAKLKNEAITVVDVEMSKGNDIEKPKKGNKFVIITIEIKNVGKEELEYNPSYFKIKDSKGKTIDEALTTINSSNYLKLGKLDPKEQITGTIAFEVPEGDGEKILVYKNNLFVDNQKIKFKLTK